MIDDDTLNLSVRKFLKQFGIKAQRAIEEAIRSADADGTLDGQSSVTATVTLELAGLDAAVEVKEDIAFAGD
jgi:hypothetical protein